VEDVDNLEGTSTIVHDLFYEVIICEYIGNIIAFL
jgi:hypothetical protein